MTKIRWAIIHLNMADGRRWEKYAPILYKQYERNLVEWEKHIKFLDDQCGKWITEEKVHFYKPL